MTIPKKKKQAKTGILSQIPLKFFALYFFLSLIMIITVCFYTIKTLYPTLPPLSTLDNIYDEQNLGTVIYSSDGEELATIAKERRYWVTYDNISKSMIDAVIAAEDQRFYKHWGISFPDILRAIKEDITHLKLKQGASTITQQLAKKLYYGPKKDISRKLKEMITAIQIERTYTKSEILEMYLNKMDFGNNTYGIQAAAQVYFNKDAAELTVPESALLAGILNNPSINNPRSQIEKYRVNALNRRNLVLSLMVQTGKIPQSYAEQEIQKSIELPNRTEPVLGKAHHFTKLISNELNTKYGEEYVTTSGLKVHTTLDYRLQKVAADSLARQLDYIQKNYANKRIKYIRPKGLTDEEALKDSLAKTVVQGALVALDVKTGAILAMVGGVGYEGKNYFNRVVQALRQPGSAFKPFVYTTALDNGWRCCDTILDSYVIYYNVDGIGTNWEPQNFEKKYNGIISLRDALKKSINIPAIKLMNDTDNRGVGAQNVINYARKMGITTPLEPVKSLAVGTGHVKLIELVSAYTIFPNLGIKTNTFLIKDIYDKNNNLIFSQPNGEGAKSEVLDPGVASLMVTMLKSVVKEGTASAISKTGMSNRPCAGKTGTGNEYKDAWFIGFTPYISCGIWIGFDSEETTLGGNLFGTGAAAALPIWAGFMEKASEILGYPEDDFKYASNITTLRLCKSSYQKATPNCPESSVYTEYFLNGTEISESCHVHGRFKNIPGTTRSTVNQRNKRGF
jgi:penicillin-binding protein 1A